MTQNLRAVLDALAVPFPKDIIGKKPVTWCRACEVGGCAEHSTWAHCSTCDRIMTPAHDHLDFVGHAYVRERLNEVDAEWNWRPMAFDERGLPQFDENRGLWIWLTVGGKTHPGYGDAPGARGGNAVKECIGDALRNAGQSFGIALDLWKHDLQHRAAVAAGVQPAPEQDANEADKLRAEIVRRGRRRYKTYVGTLRAFENWANDTAEWTTADLTVLAGFLAHVEKRA
ncbi:hypothetical protein [Amycolatopsis solani]|uniref:hypothetical protein n=1 Tax=Amycolatopsis solani TaxID=3028615 RepID=UPI0025B1A437|nr:hypothetical protein [Amycolatopsis sp. MEP2-6]